VTVPASARLARSARRAGIACEKKNSPVVPDNGAVIPPDTQGTVGPNHLMAALNSNITIETRTGVCSQFGARGFVLGEPRRCYEAFDPRGAVRQVQHNRWIMSAGANAASPTAYILIGVSQTSDPTGAWNLSQGERPMRRAQAGRTIRRSASTVIGSWCRPTSSP